MQAHWPLYHTYTHIYLLHTYLYIRFMFYTLRQYGDDSTALPTPPLPELS